MSQWWGSLVQVGIRCSSSEAGQSVKSYGVGNRNSIRRLRYDGRVLTRIVRSLLAVFEEVDDSLRFRVSLGL